MSTTPPIDAVEAVLQRSPASGGKRGPYRKKQLIDVSVKQLLMARDVQSMLKKDVELAKKEDRSLGLEWLREFNALTTTITNATEQIRRSRKEERAAMGGLSNEQLDDVLRMHLPRIANGLEERDRRTILALWFGPEVAEVLLRSREATPTGATP